MRTETEFERIVRQADWYASVDASSGLAHHLKAYWPEIKAEITKLRAERDAAAREATILRSAIKDYLSGDYENPRKHRAGGPQERCDHGRYYWEVCDSCADAHFERALAIIATSGKDAP